jgi:hypothetical protein
MDGHAARRERLEIRTNILIGKPEGKKRLGKPRHRWEDNIRMDLRVIVWEVVDWIAQDRNQWLALVNAVMNFRVP